MSTTFDGFPLAPRRGSELLALVIARISTVHQDVRSLADQIALCEKYVRDRYPDPPYAEPHRARQPARNASNPPRSIAPRARSMSRI